VPLAPPELVIPPEPIAPAWPGTPPEAPPPPPVPEAPLLPLEQPEQRRSANAVAEAKIEDVLGERKITPWRIE
jgi:hypothetical protein